MVREQLIEIKAYDGKSIYGKLIDDNSKPLVIMSHGLTDNMDSREMFCGAWFLADHGFSTFRFSYYDGLKNARDITDCTLETHAKDLDTVVGHFKAKSFKPIYIVGHSFGALTIILSNEQAFDGAVLWDPSHPDVGLGDLIYVKELHGYLIKWGADYLIGSNMVTNFKQLNVNEALEKYDMPTLLISAGKGELRKVVNNLYLKRLKEPKELIEIKGADHNFSNEGNFDELIKVTTAWLSKQS